MPRLRPRAERPWQSGRRAVLAFTLLMIALGYMVVGWRSQSAAAARLPPLPDVTERPAALVQHLTETNAAARRSPTDPVVVGALGMAYHADLFYEQAAAAYTLAEELDTSGWRWTYYRALVHIERAQASAAADALRAVVNIQPEFSLAWWRLGETAFKQARYDEADAAYMRAESAAAGKKDETDVAAYAGVGRGRVALYRGDPAAAGGILESVLQVQPRFAIAHRMLAEALRAQNRETDSERHATRAEALRAYTPPRDPHVDALADISRSSIFLLRYAASLDLMHDGARRERVLRRALEVDPDNPDIVYEMGALLQQLRRPADALPFFVRHLDLTTDDQQTLVQIGKCYSDLGRLDEAEQSLRQALAIGDDAVGMYNLGLVFEQRHRIEDAEASYRRAIALGPGLARARNNLGSLVAQTGRLQEAAPHLLEAIRLDPTSPDAYTNLSAVMLQLNALDKAAYYARLAIEADPRHADAHVNLAVALAGLGDLDSARRHLDEALGIDPQHAAANANRKSLGPSKP